MEQIDSNVEGVRQMLKRRAEIGLTKYGVTTDRTDIDLLGWLQHLQEELMDASVYVEKIKSELTTVNVNNDGVAVGEYRYKAMDICPWGVKVLLLTQNGIAVTGTVSAQNRGYFSGWFPLPKKPLGA